MNAESSRLRPTGVTSSDMRAIWPGALLIVYLAATGTLLVAARPTIAIAALHAVLLATIAFTTLRSGAAPWLRAWTPLLVLFFLYAELPTLIAAAGHVQPLDEVVIRWEQRLFGGQPARSWAARDGTPLLSEMLHFAYLSYYPIIYALPVALWFGRRREDFATAALGLLLTFVACFACYIAFPVAGPRYLWTSAAPDGVFRSTATWLLQSGSSRGTAFPSSHVAVAVAQSILAARLLPRLGVPIVFLTVGLGAGAVYGGFHYAVDVLAGAVLGALTAGIALAVRPRPANQANAIAPT
jgi:membrane-associated phospholipid phosphatase